MDLAVVIHLHSSLVVVELLVEEDIRVVVADSSSFTLEEAFRLGYFLLVLYLCVFVNKVQK